MADPIVVVDDVVKVFPGDVRALDGVSLSFQPGVIYGLLGPNGAGKTTLIRVLATLLRPDSGSARIAGIDVATDPAAVRRRIGLAGQFAAVDLYQTGRENVEMVARLYGLSRPDARRQATDVLERMGLVDAADRTVRTYSGGMRRRLDLAASIVGRPQVLFLDEPTTGVDPASRIDIWQLIEELIEGGTTVLLTTQYLDEADRLADRVAVIDNGRLITEGTTDELKEELGGSVLELSIEEADRAAATEALRSLAEGELTYDETLHEITIAAPGGTRTLMEAIRRLDGVGVVPTDAALHRPTLDDVFLALTGHAADSEDDARGAGAPSGGRRRRGVLRRTGRMS